MVREAISPRLAVVEDILEDRDSNLGRERKKPWTFVVPRLIRHKKVHCDLYNTIDVGQNLVLLLFLG